jgi:hypothetical protein
MVSKTRTMSERWEATTNLTGVTTASLIVVVLVATAVGTLTGLLFGSQLGSEALAVVAGLSGMIAAALVRNTLLVKAWSAVGVDDPGTPAAVVTNAVLSSIVGGLATHQIAVFVGGWPAVVMCGLAGLISAALFGFLMVTYRMNPDRPEDFW